MGTSLSCFVCEKKMADITLVSRVRTRRNNDLKHGKNSKKYNSKSDIDLLFGEYLWS